MNAKMPELKRCFEHAGFRDVETILASGNVVFSASRLSEATLAKKAEAAMTQVLGRSFPVIVRSVEVLQELLSQDPFAPFHVSAREKRVVTFLRNAPEKGRKLSLPLELDGARILCVAQREVFTTYVPSSTGAAFMRLIEQTFGKELTTRTWDTVRKVAK